MKINQNNLLLILLIFFTFTIRFFRIDYPQTYVFDEVYHAFTAKEMLSGHKEAWEWWNVPPPGVAYEWTHPPLAKEFMALSMFIFGSTDPWAWRIPGVIMGTLSIYLVYLITLTLFKKQSMALMAGFIFSIDGLNFVQSRVGMNDIYFVTFSLASLLFLLNKKFLFSAIFLGFALSSKWTSLYLYALEGILLLKNRNFKQIVYFILIPPIIYLLSYLPFFLLNHTTSQFIELQKQMWWYHTNLKASHNYSSPWWSWPLNLYPIWYFVEYHKNNLVSNIFGSGNPIIFWMGTGALLVTIWDFFKTRSTPLFIILLSFFIFWLPWALSPRIMFLYHFSPCVPFLSIILAYQLDLLTTHKKNYPLVLGILGAFLISFILIYPMLSGIPLPRSSIDLFFDFNLSKNPFRG